MVATKDEAEALWAYRLAKEAGGGQDVAALEFIRAMRLLRSEILSLRSPTASESMSSRCSEDDVLSISTDA